MDDAVEPTRAAGILHRPDETDLDTSYGEQMSLERFHLSMKTTLDTKFTEIFGKFDGITKKIESIEVRQKALEEELKNSPVSSIISSPSISTPGRQRRTPLALQVGAIS